MLAWNTEDLDRPAVMPELKPQGADSFSGASAVSADGNLAVSGTGGGGAYLWDLSDPASPRIYSEPAVYVKGIVAVVRVESRRRSAGGVLAGRQQHCVGRRFRSIGTEAAVVDRCRLLPADDGISTGHRHLGDRERQERSGSVGRVERSVAPGGGDGGWDSKATH